MVNMIYTSEIELIIIYIEIRIDGIKIVIRLELMIKIEIIIIEMVWGVIIIIKLVLVVIRLEMIRYEGEYIDPRNGVVFRVFEFENIEINEIRNIDIILQGESDFDEPYIVYIVGLYIIDMINFDDGHIKWVVPIKINILLISI